MASCVYVESDSDGLRTHCRTNMCTRVLGMCLYCMLLVFVFVCMLFVCCFCLCVCRFVSAAIYIYIACCRYCFRQICIVMPFFQLLLLCLVVYGRFVSSPSFCLPVVCVIAVFCCFVTAVVCHCRFVLILLGVYLFSVVVLVIVVVCFSGRVLSCVLPLGARRPLGT